MQCFSNKSMNLGNKYEKRVQIFGGIFQVDLSFSRIVIIQIGLLYLLGFTYFYKRNSSRPFALSTNKLRTHRYNLWSSVNVPAR